jgi:hypothetical protein
LSVKSNASVPDSLTYDAADLTDKMLASYWRAKYDTLRNESTPALIRSLRSQLQTCKRLAQEAEPDALAMIVFHADLGLSLKV